MTDVLTRAQRRFNMSRVRSRDTRPEMLLRRGLHARGLRYRLHPSSVPGRPDLVFPRHRAVILAHGCFWHGHDCPLFRWPATRPDFWRRKIERNRARDLDVLARLQNAGGRVMIVWECALRGRQKRDPVQVIDQCEQYVRSGTDKFRDLRGGGAA